MIYKVRTPPKMTGYLKGDTSKLCDYLKTLNANLKVMFQNLGDDNIKSISASKINAAASSSGILTITSDDGAKVVIEPSGSGMYVSFSNSDNSQFITMQNNNIDIICNSIKANLYEGSNVETTNNLETAAETN